MRAAILEIVANQLRELNPPETSQTYDRLLADGYSDTQACELIGAVVSSEVFSMLKDNKPYDHERYVKALAKLPSMPWE